MAHYGRRYGTALLVHKCRGNVTQRQAETLFEMILFLGSFALARQAAVLAGDLTLPPLFPSIDMARLIIVSVFVIFDP